VEKRTHHADCEHLVFVNPSGRTPAVASGQGLK
jgi:hypothetical protein